MKLCKDCKRFSGSAFCNAPENGLSALDGEPLGRFASLNRCSAYFEETACGPEASFFTPKDVPRKPWWVRIFKA